MRRGVKFVAVFSAAVMSVGLAGCSEPVTSGIVIDKTFVPEHERDGQCLSSIDMGSGVKVCVLYDKILVPDAWHLTLESVASAEDEGGRKQEVSVSESVFEAVTVGESFDVEGCLNVNGPDNC